VSVPFALMLPVMLGFMGLAIDLSVLYARNVELQHVADGAAVAAARELNGTAAGVTNAKNKAKAAVESNFFMLSTTAFSSGSTWGSSALYLSSAPSGAPWVPADSIADDASAANLLYVKADTAALNEMSGAPGVVSTSFMRALGSTADLTATPVAVAGRTSMQVTPLGICALKTVKFTSRASTAGNELVEYGYRRGISYDLLQINPVDSTPQNFIVNPVAAGTASSLPAHFTTSAIKPYFCSGSVAYANVRPGATVHVQPLAGLDVHDWLNSRFGDAGCQTRDGAPTDTNVREFKNPYSWMPTALPAALPANITTVLSPQPRKTVADLEGEASSAGSITADKYGPLWVYNKPVKYVSSSPTGTAGVMFATTDWGVMYPVTSGPLVQPNATPGYIATPYVKQFTAPSAGAAYTDRRVLNIPLLNCSAPVGNTATVLGIGKFFMISRATSTAIYAEFAGLASDEKLASFVALHQ
jgi:Flp pilus assembly protein TadG